MNTTYFKDLIMRNLFGIGSPPAIPSNYYIGLSSTTPLEDGTNVNEPSTVNTGYTRVRLSSLITGATAGVITNSSAIQFPESEADWFPAATPATYYVIYDSLTGGNLLMYNELTKSRIIEINTIAILKARSLNIQLTDTV